MLLGKWAVLFQDEFKHVTSDDNLLLQSASLQVMSNASVFLHAMYI